MKAILLVVLCYLLASCTSQPQPPMEKPQDPPPAILSDTRVNASQVPPSALDVHSPIAEGNSAGFADKPAMIYYRNPEFPELVAVPVRMLAADRPTRLAKQIIEMLSVQPKDEPVQVVWPEYIYIREVYLLEKEKAIIVDFDTSTFKNMSLGVEDELLLVYSLVNSLLENLEGYEEVRILINGTIQEVLLGHVDIEHGLNKNERLVFREEQHLLDQIEVEDLLGNPKQ